MKSFSNTPQLSVGCMGEAARDFLKSDSKGRILAVFSNVVYLDSIDDELFWLATKNMPMHRRCVQIHGALSRDSADSSFIVKGQHLILGKDIEIDLEPASIWVSPRPNPGTLIPFEELHDRLWAISGLFDDFPSPTGFGSILSEVTRSAIGSPMTDALPDYGRALKYAWPTLKEIIQACKANDYPQMLRMAENLLGLGEGLTPSGDDFIGGYLFANFTLQEIYTQYQGLNRPDVELFLENSRNRTNLISYTMLKDLATGHASDTLQLFVNAVLTDHHPDNIRYLGLKLVRTGHSTGWDLLTGLWTGILLSTGLKTTLPYTGPAFTFS